MVTYGDRWTKMEMEIKDVEVEDRIQEDFCSFTPTIRSNVGGRQADRQLFMKIIIYLHVVCIPRQNSRGKNDGQAYE